MILFDSKKLHESMEIVFHNVGLENGSIHHVVSSMIETSLRGVDSHGINLFPHYVNAIIHGRINKNPSFSFEKKSESTYILNADHAIGHHAGAVAMDQAIKTAKKTGMCSVSVKKSTHFGAAAYFGLMAAEKNCLGFAFTNADALVKVANGRSTFFGTNPICFTAPLINEAPLCLDMATSSISWNKLKNYAREGMDLPLHLAFNAEGITVSDPNDAVSLAPIGDYKGYGLGMMIEILCGILANSPIGKDIKPMYGAPLSERRNISQFFMVIDIEKFIPIGVFKNNLQSMVDKIRKIPPLDNDNTVMVPGDPEKKSLVIRRERGIPIDPAKFEEFCNVDQRFKDCVK